MGRLDEGTCWTWVSSPPAHAPRPKRGCAHPHSSPEPPAHLHTLVGRCGHGAVLCRAGPAARSGTAAKAGGSSPAAAPGRCQPSSRSPLPRMARLGSPFPRPNASPWPNRTPGRLKGPVATSSWSSRSGNDTATSTTTRDTGVLNYIVYWGSAAGVSSLSTAGA